MKMTFKLYYDFSDQQLDIINELSFHTTKLYNTVNYNMRNNVYQNYKANEKVYKTNWHTEYLHSHNYQQCLRVLEQNWKSYFASIKDYNNGGQNKYTGKPMPPKSKYFKNEVIFTKHAIKRATIKVPQVIKNDLLQLSLSKEIQSKFGIKSIDFNMKNVKMPKRFDFNKIQQIRFIYDKRLRKWYLLMIYEVDKKRLIFNGDRNKMDIMSIDLGLNNLATCVFNESKKTYIIDGLILKSKQAYINKQISILQSKEMKRLGGSKKYKDTKRIRKLREQYNFFTTDYIHKCSKKIIDLALKHNCGTIIIGDFKGVKRGNKNARLFVKVPHRDLIDKIKYKAELYDILVINQEESFTSGCSVLDNEPVNVLYYNKSRRVSRGMFVTNNGFFINADVNGAYNIMKKKTSSNPICLTSAISYVLINNVLVNNATSNIGNMGNGVMTAHRELSHLQPKRIRYMKKNEKKK